MQHTDPQPPKQAWNVFEKYKQFLQSDDEEEVKTLAFIPIKKPSASAPLVQKKHQSNDSDPKFRQLSISKFGSTAFVHGKNVSI